MARIFLFNLPLVLQSSTSIQNYLDKFFSVVQVLYQIHRLCSFVRQGLLHFVPLVFLDDFDQQSVVEHSAEVDSVLIQKVLAHHRSARNI